MTTLEDLQKTIHATAVDKGWWPVDKSQRNVGEQIALMHSELSEALEEYRAHGLNDYSNEGKPEGFGTELADCIIRILDTAGAYGIDMEALILRKIAYNKTRPYRHGNKLA